MKRSILSLLTVLIVGTADAQQVCPCVPVSNLWAIETCDTWNCAASAMIVANGDRNVLSMPAPTNDGRWLILKRVTSGSYIAPPDAPFVLETFDGVDGASARYASVPADRYPMLLSVPDGKFVMVMSRDPIVRTRAVQR